MTAATAVASADHPALARRARNDKRRRFVTPEGVDLSLEIASAGLRFIALFIDLCLMLLILIAVTYLLISGGPDNSGSMLIIIWLLGFFLLRNGWFVLFELGPRAATPGKRLMGIRVVARDGGRLEVSSVVARNFVREVEMFLPISFMAGAAGQDMVDSAMAITGLGWTLGMSLFLLFNKDRMRLGDLIGGTWVVVARRSKIAVDLSAAQAPADAALTFTPAELAIYGIYELQELERVLRDRDAKVMRAVADTIRAKMGRPMMGDDGDFLIAYYGQLKLRLERDLLFGKRKEHKFEA